MTSVLTWNIQNGKGVDGVISLERIASVIGSMGQPDIICLQEVSRHLPLAGGNAPDQVAELRALFSGYEVIFGSAIEADRDGDRPRWQYGNATLSRLPVVSVFRHPLPQPADNRIRCMPRQVTEVTVATGSGDLRTLNTHLEFHSERQRLSQVARLRDLVGEAFANNELPPAPDAEGSYQALRRPASCVICGDFNFEAGWPEYEVLVAGNERDGSRLSDSWPVARKGEPHEPTCGVHDRVQWPQGPHCRDFFFVSPDIAGLQLNLSVDCATDASDHQPLMLTIAGR